MFRCDKIVLDQGVKNLFNKDEHSKFEELDDDVQDLAQELYEIDSGDVTFKVVQIAIMYQTRMVVYFYVSKSINQKLLLLLQLFLGDMFKGKSLFARVVLGIVLLFEIYVKYTCMVLTSLICAQSSNMMDLLANAFGIFVLVEYGVLASNYILMNIENEQLELTMREDFMTLE